LGLGKLNIIVSISQFTLKHHLRSEDVRVLVVLEDVVVLRRGHDDTNGLADLRLEANVTLGIVHVDVLEAIKGID